jgi:hypothetical protein
MKLQIATIFAIGVALIAPSAEAKTFHGETGHRTDPDSGNGKVDGYLRIDAVNADGSWTGFQHTSPTGILGGCSRGTLVFYDANNVQLYTKELGTWCVNGRKQPSSDNQGPLSGQANDIPPNVVSAAVKMAVVVSPGSKNIRIPIEDIIRIGIAIASAASG